MTESSFPNFSKRGPLSDQKRAPGNLRKKSSVNQLESDKIDFDNNFIFSTMNYNTNKKISKNYSMYSELRVKDVGRLSSRSSSKNKWKSEKLKPKIFKKKQTQKNKGCFPESRTPAKNISIRKQMKEVEKEGAKGSGSIPQKRVNLRNVNRKQFVINNSKNKKSKLLLSARNNSHDKRSLKSSFYRGFSKPSSIEKNIKPRHPSFDKYQQMLGLSKFSREKKEIKKMILNKNIFGKIQHLRRNTSNGYREVQSKRNFLKNKKDSANAHRFLASQEKHVKSTKNKRLLPNQKSFLGKGRPVLEAKKVRGAKKSDRFIKIAQKKFKNESTEKFKQIRKRSPLANKLLKRKSFDKYGSRRLFPLILRKNENFVENFEKIDLFVHKKEFQLI